MTQEEERELRAQLARLQQEHRDLDAAIAALQESPGSDLIQVQRLKKRKLHLRDRITFIEDQLTPGYYRVAVIPRRAKHEPGIHSHDFARSATILQISCLRIS